jgi:hypothetical protein
MDERTKKTETKIFFKGKSIDNPYKIAIDLCFSQEQYNLIKKGLKPKEMEDKWFIYFENEWLYFHRSWTGYGIYKAEIIENNGKYYIKEFFVERNKEKYKNIDDNRDIQNFTFLIARGLLKVDLREIFFLNNNEKEAMKLWSNFGSLYISKEEMK